MVFYLVLSVVIAIALSALSVDILVIILRKRGRYPAKGKVTLEDVRRLVAEGEHTLAMRAYRELYGATLREAKAAVEELEKE